MKNKYVLLLALLVTGCNPSEEPMQNSPLTNRLLDHFAAGLRFGDSFEAAAKRGSTVDSHIDESGSTMRLLLPRAEHGLSGVRLLGTAALPGDAGSSRVHSVILFSRPDSAQIALIGTKTDAEHMFGSPGKQGCIGYSDQHTTRVTVWEDDGGGGMALVEPIRESSSPNEALTRLIVYPRGRKAKDALPGFRAKCQKEYGATSMRAASTGR